jgi:hypothetical protein
LRPSLPLARTEGRRYYRSLPEPAGKRPGLERRREADDPSWLNQVELWFGIFTRKGLAAASFASIAQLVRQSATSLHSTIETSHPSSGVSVRSRMPNCKILSSTYAIRHLATLSKVGTLEGNNDLALRIRQCYTYHNLSPVSSALA